MGGSSMNILTHVLLPMYVLFIEDHGLLDSVVDEHLPKKTDTSWSMRYEPLGAPFLMCMNWELAYNTC